MVASSTQNYADQAVNLSSEPCTIGKLSLTLFHVGAKLGWIPPTLLMSRSMPSAGSRLYLCPLPAVFIDDLALDLMQPATQAYVADRLPAGFAATP